MRYINLTDGFSITSSSHIAYKLSFFSGGEPSIRIEENPSCEEITYVTRINTANDLIVLCCAVDALNRVNGNHKKNLFMPYSPAARQDRVCRKGEALTSKVYADIINSLGFDSVEILDPHSDVTTALINNCSAISPAEFWSRLPMLPKDIVAIPDFGATKRIEKRYTTNTIQCSKKRSESGSLIEFNVFADDLEGRDVWILDDICDGGGTFLGLASVLREKNCGKINLAVTHGIFSKGVGHVLTEIDNVYTTDSWSNYENELEAYSPFNVIKIKDIYNGL